MMNSKLLLSAVLITGCAGAAMAQQSKVCLSGICIGARLDELPANIKWQSAKPFNPQGTSFLPSDWGKRLADNIQAEPSVIRELEQYRDVSGGLGALNSRMIAALMKIRGACNGLSVKGKFTSESGHDTIVTIKAYPSSDGATQQIQVSELVRYYKNVNSDEERDRLAEQLQAQFNVPVQATFSSAVRGSFQRSVRLTKDDEVRIQLNRSGIGNGSYLVALESKEFMNSSALNQNVHRQLPGCSRPQKVD